LNQEVKTMRRIVGVLITKKKALDLKELIDICFNNPRKNIDGELYFLVWVGVLEKLETNGRNIRYRVSKNTKDVVCGKIKRI